MCGLVKGRNCPLNTFLKIAYSYFSAKISLKYSLKNTIIFQNQNILAYNFDTNLILLTDFTPVDLELESIFLAASMDPSVKNSLLK